jgi:DNA repair protein RecN (Recombination protein N)
MLTELRIENFAIIESLQLSFTPGLTIFTGETGAGKSILIDAVETLLGGRAEITLIRSGAQRAIVEGLFTITEPVRNQVHNILSREELLDDPNLLTLSREIRLEGRNISRVNGRSVNLAILRELGEILVDIHGQSEHLSLLRASQHIRLLDEFAAVSSLLALYRGFYQKLQNVGREIAALIEDERESARRIDMLSFQINEIEAARLQPGEDIGLSSERDRLANAESLSSLVQEARLILDEGTPDTPSAIDLFGQVMHNLINLGRLDTTQAELVNQAQILFDGLTELSRQLNRYNENIEFNPKKLDQVEERLALIQSLKKKYGDTIEHILNYAENAKNELNLITSASSRILELKEEQEQLLRKIKESGVALSNKRQEYAHILSRAVEMELAELHMSNTQFKVEFHYQEDPNGISLDDGRQIAFYSHGLEQIEFMIAPNPGEGFKPLVKIASGGETSRLMLALKNVLVSADHVPNLIFDEIDQGIGGRVGGIVGKKLWNLGKEHQVFCVTHLPQLAAYGEQHYHVHKEIQAGRTITRLEKLEGDSRINELAQMMGGISEGTLQSARELLMNVNRQPSGKSPD